MNYSLYKAYQQMLNNKAYQLLWEFFMVENAHIYDVGVFNY
jgi:hypothetical protein